MPPPEDADRHLAREGARLRWRESGAGPALVLIHGWALSLDYWDPVVPLLASAHRVLSYDRRGFGLTQGRYDPNEACDDLLALLDAAGAQSAILVGMSQGARVAIHTAIRAPRRVSRLILDGAPLLEAETELPLARYRELRDGESPAAMQREILAHPLMQLAGPDDARQGLLARCVATYRGADLDGGWQAVPAPDVALISQPTLVLNGAQDSPERRAAGSQLSQDITRARRMELDGAGHLAALDDPRGWSEAVLEFSST